MYKAFVLDRRFGVFKQKIYIYKKHSTIKFETAENVTAHYLRITKGKMSSSVTFTITIVYYFNGKTDTYEFIKYLLQIYK